MSCKVALNLMHAFQDGELDLVRSLEIEHHLHECSGCSQAYERQKALRIGLQAGDLYFQAPPALRERIQASLRGTARTGPRIPAAWKWVGAAAASVALAAGLAWGSLHWASGTAREERLTQDILTSHVRSLMLPAHTLDVVSKDQHTVKPWFKGKLSFSLPVKDYALEGFALQGGRLDFVDERQVAVLIYQHGGHDINLYIWPAESADDEKAQSLERRGYHLIHWTRKKLVFWAVSDLNAKDLGEFVDLVAGQ